MKIVFESENQKGRRENLGDSDVDERLPELILKQPNRM
jgi:hypothetical protein